MLSLIVPVYNSEANLDRLLRELLRLAENLPDHIELVFVVDGSPDRCLEILRERLASYPIPSNLVSFSRNFGSSAAIAAGLESGRGDCFAVLAADLQEPIELIDSFWRVLQTGQADVVFGCRTSRSDPFLSKALASVFWRLYRTFVMPDIPQGGVDVFACTREVRDRLLGCQGIASHIIAALFWLGFRRRFIEYERLPRREGASAWTLAKRLRYSLDAIFSFTDLPVLTLLAIGAVGVALSSIVSVTLIVARLLHHITVLGYTPIVLAIMFFGSITSFGFGIVGQYLWLTLINTQARPKFIVADRQCYSGLSEGVAADLLVFPDGVCKADLSGSPR